jgi:hypothetical protein
MLAPLGTMPAVDAIDYQGIRSPARLIVGAHSVSGGSATNRLVAGAAV